MNDEQTLAHYGVMGMKWGIRKDGRPQGYQGSSGSSTKTSGKSKVAKTSTTEEEPKKRGLSDKQKRALKIGAAVIGGSIAAYGAYRFYKATDPKNSPNFDEATGLLKKKTGQKDAPVADTLAVNKFRAYLGDKGSQNNCAKCSAAYDLRRRGYDVHAGRTTTGVYRSEWDLWYDNIDHHSISPTARGKDTGGNSIFSDMIDVRAAQDMRRKQPADYKRAKDLQARKTIEKIESFGPNANGTVLCRWETGGGHSFAWETDSKGKARLVEGQLGVRGDSNLMKQVELNRVNPFSETQVLRLDTATPDLKAMSDLNVVKNDRQMNASTSDKISIAAGVVGAAGAAGAVKSIKDEETDDAKRQRSVGKA